MVENQVFALPLPPTGVFWQREVPRVVDGQLGRDQSWCILFDSLCHGFLGDDLCWCVF
jgi:hypothetical protein